MWITSHTRMAIIFFLKENKSSVVIEKVEPLYSTDGGVKWFSCGKYFSNSTKVEYGVNA